MAPMAKKTCINSPTHTYTGKEATPYGLGYVAEVEPTGKIMEGRDKRMWMVGIRNGVKVWCPVPTELTKDAPVIQTQEIKPVTLVEVPKTPKAPRKKKSDKPNIKIEEEEEEEEKEEEKEEKKEEQKEEEAKPIQEEKEKEKVKPVKKQPKPKVVKNLEEEFNAEQKEEEEEEEEKEADVKPKEQEKEKEADVKPKKAKVKAKAPAKKAQKDAEAEAEAEGDDKKKVVVKRQPTKFNLYVQFRLKNMDEALKAMPHQARFGEFAKEWKAMSDEEKAKIV